MKVDDIDSIVHLLKSISIWGMLFILLVILPLYIAAWAGIMKLLKLNNINTKKFLITIFASFAIALIMLKIGINRDQQKRLRADRVKHYLTTYGYPGRSFNDLKDFGDSTDFYEIIDRFPEDFTITYFDNEKGLILTNEEALTRIKKINDSVVPVAYNLLKNQLAPGDTIGYIRLARIDERFNRIVIEPLVTKFSNEFTLVNFGQPDVHYLKRIK